MAIKEINGFNHESIKKNLLKMGKEAHYLHTINDYVFSDCISDLMGELDSVFDSKVGNKALPRAMLLGVMLHGAHSHMDDLSDIARECKVNEVLKVFTCNKTPSATTLGRFLTNSDELIIKKVFLYTLVQLNDLNLLKFLRAFVDGTDALVNGSKHYKITRDEFEALKLMKEWELIHKNTQKSIIKTKKILLKKLEEFKDDEEVFNLIKLVLRRITFYNRNVCNKINEFEEAFSQTKKNFICVMFPSAVMMPTKKGNYDFGFNLQEIMTENNIILTGILSNKANDNTCMDEVLTELKENFTILLELVKKYGCRRNYKEIESMLKKTYFCF